MKSFSELENSAVGICDFCKRRVETKFIEQPGILSAFKSICFPCFGELSNKYDLSKPGMISAILSFKQDDAAQSPNPGSQTKQSAVTLDFVAKGFSDLGKGLLGLGFLVFAGFFLYLCISPNKEHAIQPPPATQYQSQEQAPPPPPADIPVLELISWHAESEYGFAIIEGLVKNISNENLENIEAEVSFFTKEGDFITSSEALLKYNPVLPNQTSPFSISATFNPRMSKKNITVNFKELGGGSINWIKATKK